MGSRGGGRGRGRFGGGSFRYAKQEPFVLFPDIQLPAIDKVKVQKGMALVKLRNMMQKEMKNLPYFLKDTLDDEKDSVDIERYSDNRNKRIGFRASLENSGYMILKPGYFPLELVRGTKYRTGRKLQWNPNRGLKKLDILEELENRAKDDNVEGEKGEEGDDDEDSDVEEEPKSEEEDQGDYEQVNFSDDEDDFNPMEDDDDEAIL